MVQEQLAKANDGKEKATNLLASACTMQFLRVKSAALARSEASKEKMTHIAAEGRAQKIAYQTAEDKRRWWLDKKASL